MSFSFACWGYSSLSAYINVTSPHTQKKWHTELTKSAGDDSVTIGIKNKKRYKVESEVRPMEEISWCSSSIWYGIMYLTDECALPCEHGDASEMLNGQQHILQSLKAVCIRWDCRKTMGCVAIDCSMKQYREQKLNCLPGRPFSLKEETRLRNGFGSGIFFANLWSGRKII